MLLWRFPRWAITGCCRLTSSNTTWSWNGFFKLCHSPFQQWHRVENSSSLRRKICFICLFPPAWFMHQFLQHKACRHVYTEVGGSSRPPMWGLNSFIFFRWDCRCWEVKITITLPHSQQLALMFTPRPALTAAGRNNSFVSFLPSVWVINVWDLFLLRSTNTAASSVIGFERMTFNIWQLSSHINSGEPRSKLKVDPTANEFAPNWENRSSRSINFLRTLISELLRQTALCDQVTPATFSTFQPLHGWFSTDAYDNLVKTMFKNDAHFLGCLRSADQKY